MTLRIVVFFKVSLLCNSNLLRGSPTDSRLEKLPLFSVLQNLHADPMSAVKLICEINVLDKNLGFSF